MRLPGQTWFADASLVLAGSDRAPNLARVAESDAPQSELICSTKAPGRLPIFARKLRAEFTVNGVDPPAAREIDATPKVSKPRYHR